MVDVPFSYVWPEPLDRNTQKLVDNVDKHIAENDDDFRLLIFGKTGTGKSRLGLHIFDRYMKRNADIKLFGLNQKAYAEAVKLAKDMRLSDRDKRVACVYDEANILSTELMSEFPKEVMRLFAEIRGLNIFHMWAMPNPRRLPDDFTAEMFNGILWIVSKEKKKPRLFFYWTTKKINRLREKTGSEAHPAKITYANLNRWRKEADFKGCFRDYEGSLLEDYKRMKERKMSERVDDFFERFGNKEEAVGITEAANKLSIGISTTWGYINDGIKDGSLVKDKDYIVSAAGTMKLLPKAFDKLKKEPKMKVLKGLKGL